jgi:hypothetical protein
MKGRYPGGHGSGKAAGPARRGRSVLCSRLRAAARTPVSLEGTRSGLAEQLGQLGVEVEEGGLLPGGHQFVGAGQERADLGGAGLEQGMAVWRPELDVQDLLPARCPVL